MSSYRPVSLLASLNVLQSHICGRTQQVRVMKELSNEFKVYGGVPQCSLLSPLLFSLFIIMLLENCNQLIFLLSADDAKFLGIGLKPESIQDDLNLLFEWATLKKLPFNVEKWDYGISGTQMSPKRPIRNHLLFIIIFNNNEMIVLRDKGNIISENCKGDVKVNKYTFVRSNPLL